MSKNVQGLDVLGRRYAAWVRTITLPLAAGAGFLSAPDGEMRTRVLCAAAVVGLWSAVYVRRVRTGPTAWLTIVDTAVLSAGALCTVWLVAPAWLSAGKSWVVPFLSFAAVVYQYYASRVLGALCAGCLTVSMLAGTAVALPAGASSAGLVTAAWSLVLAVLGRLLWTFVMAGATRADDMLAVVEAARTAQAAAARDRAAENEWAAVLHDNPAQTLMLVGQGRIGDATVLAAAARRDLIALATNNREGTREVDLAARLLPVLEIVPDHRQHPHHGRAARPGRGRRCLRRRDDRGPQQRAPACRHRRGAGRRR